MPVTKQATVAHYLTEMVVSISAGYIRCVFSRYIDDVASGSVEMMVTGEQMTALLATQAIAGQALGDEVTDAVYNLAITNGVIAGTIS